MAELSILIPARNEEWLANTVEDILQHMEGDTEIVVVCDGNWPEPPIKDDPRVHIIYHGEARGQRQGVNEAARLSRADYILKCDAHCAFDQGFDVKLLKPYKTGELTQDTTTVPRMYNLHVFSWVCKVCGNRNYHAPKPTKCELDTCKDCKAANKGNKGEKCLTCKHHGHECSNTTEFEKELVWQPRWNRCSDFARFDRTMHFQYWGGYKERPEAQSDIADLMCFVGACWLMPRKRFWEMDGCDERHGSWGQMGVEISCKSWLSGGRLVVNKRTWFAHLFRTQPGFGFPYPQSGKQVARAREHSRWLWMEGRWPKAKHDLLWLIQKFAPVPEWDDYLLEGSKHLPPLPAKAEAPDEEQEVPAEEYVEEEKVILPKVVEPELKAPVFSRGATFVVPKESADPRIIFYGAGGGGIHPIDPKPAIGVGGPPGSHELKAPVFSRGVTKGMVYYTDNRCEERVLLTVRHRLLQIAVEKDLNIVAVGLYPTDYFHPGGQKAGRVKNIHLGQPRGYLTMFRQILAGLEACEADVVFLTEHDVLYHPCHFDFIPIREDVYYYNEHTYKVDAKDGKAVFYYTKQTSGLCASRELLLQHYRTRVKRVEEEGFTRQMGFEPGTHSPPRGVDNFKAEGWWARLPNVDIRHKTNLTESRWDPKQFRSQRSCRGWTMVDEVPGWGVTKGRFDEFLRETEDAL